MGCDPTPDRPDELGRNRIHQDPTFGEDAGIMLELDGFRDPPAGKSGALPGLPQGLHRGLERPPDPDPRGAGLDRGGRHHEAHLAVAGDDDFVGAHGSESTGEADPKHRDRSFGFETARTGPAEPT